MSQGRSRQGQKGNPASIRQGNLKKIANREQSYLRGQRRHRINAEINASLHEERLANHGLGRRECRRIAAHIRTQIPEAFFEPGT